MSFSSHHFENSFEVNSSPQQLFKNYIHAPLDSVSTRVLNFLKALMAFDLFLKIATHINLEKY